MLEYSSVQMFFSTLEHSNIGTINLTHYARDQSYTYPHNYLQ